MLSRRPHVPVVFATLDHPLISQSPSGYIAVYVKQAELCLFCDCNSRAEARGYHDTAAQLKCTNVLEPTAMVGRIRWCVAALIGIFGAIADGELRTGECVH